MTPPANEKRRPGEQGGALKIAGRRIGADGTPVDSIAPSCPLACSPSCSVWRCPVSVGQSLAELVDELVQR